MEMGFKELFMINPVIISVMIVFSTLLLAFVLERGYTFISYAGWSQSFYLRIKAAVQAGRLHEARSLCAQSKNVFARVFYVALSSTHLTRADNEDLVQIEKEAAQEMLRKRLGLMATLSFISPLVGLLGTVLGIMQAFHDLARSGSGGANIVAAGISEALIVTAAGIMVAVPASIFYNYFTYRLRGIVVKMNNHAQELIILLYGGEEAGDKPAQPKESEIRAKAFR
jgi:biopolymer transport protein ExbB